MRWKAVARHASFALSVLVAGAAGALFVYERSGALGERVRREVFEASGEELEIERAELDWFRPSLRLFGVHLARESGPFAIDELEVSLAWRDGRIVPTRVDVLGGRVQLSEALAARVQTVLARSPAPASTGPRPPPPPIVVQRLHVDWVHPEWGLTALGRVDATYRESLGGDPQIQGRIAPAFAVPSDGALAEIYLSGTRDHDGRIALHASCNGIPISADAIPPRSPFAAARSWKPRARLQFELTASFALDAHAPPSGRLRARWSDGSLQLPTTPVPVTDVAIDLQAECSAPSLAGLLDPRAWTSTAHLEARWNAIPIDAWALFGTNAGPGLSARAWVHAPRLPLQRTTAEVAGSTEIATEIFEAVDPGGVADVLAGVRWPAASSITDERASLSPEIAIELDARGTSTACVHGWFDPSRDRRDGFPMRVEQITGHIVAVHDQSGARPTLVALLEILGAHSKGTRAQCPGFADGLILVPTGGGQPSFDLRVGGHGIPIDAELERSLHGIQGTEFIFPEFSPAGGSCAIVARLVMEPGYRHPAGDVLVEVFGAGAAWKPLPIALQSVSGQIDFLADRRGFTAAGLDLRARSHNGVPVLIRGRLQDVPDVGLINFPWHLRHYEWIGVDALGIAPRGDDGRTIGESFPEVGAILGKLSPSGKLDVRYRGGTPRAGGPREWSAEIAARGAGLVPQQFPVELSQVRGRVLVRGSMPLLPAPGEAAPTTVRVAPLVGECRGAALVAADAEFPPESDGRFEILAAGVDPSNKNLMGAFQSARAGGLGSGHSGLALSNLNVTGRVDFSGTFRMPHASPRAPESHYRVLLRENDLRTTGVGSQLSLGRLAGILEQRADGPLAGEHLTALVADTPIELRGARFEQQGDGYRIETAIEALQLPIDREHFDAFLDEDTLAALLDDLGWRGEMDLSRAQLVLTSSPRDGDGAQFSGDVVPRGMSIDLGVPVTIDSAKVRIASITYDRSAVHASVEVSELAGAISDRSVTGAAFRIEYDHPQLRIEGFSGELEHGRVTQAGGGESSKPAFALDLRAPYPFSLALELEQIDVGGLLRGIFESEFASRGELSGQLALSGDLERLTGIVGRGFVVIEKTVLWSVPVVRDLLAQLGVETGAVFEHVESAFSISGGRLTMTGLRVESPILKLVGEGTLDFDGSLKHDLEVQYQLLDYLPWFNRVIYWIQNSLVRVEIRGDMARPRVVTKGAFGRSIDPRRGPRDLPLPDLSPLPERF
jgi:hypothetical protein